MKRVTLSSAKILMVTKHLYCIFRNHKCRSDCNTSGWAAGLIATPRGGSGEVMRQARPFAAPGQHLGLILELSAQGSTQRVLRHALCVCVRGTGQASSKGEDAQSSTAFIAQGAAKFCHVTQ